MALAVLSAIVLPPAGAAGSRGDWPEPRQNPHLTAIQPLGGRMNNAPVELARHDLGRMAALPKRVRRASDGAVYGLVLAQGALICYTSSGDQAWQTHPAGLNFTEITACRDFDGDGREEILLRAGRASQPFGAAALVSLHDGGLIWRYDVEPMSYNWYLFAGNFLPNVQGEQIVVMMMGAPPDEERGYIGFFDYATPGTAPRLRWRHDFDEGYTNFPMLMTSDVTGDGVDELIVEDHSQMWIFDVEGGGLHQFLTWDVSPANVRSRGLVRFVDLTGDGREDFLCIATFAQHHELLVNRNGKMERAWHHGWPTSVTVADVATTWPEPPYADLDGDGDLELVVSMYNSEGNVRWLLRVYDAATGALVTTMPGMVATSISDLDGDGLPEIIANETTDPTQTAHLGMRLIRMRGGQLQEFYEGDVLATKCRLTDFYYPPRPDGQPSVGTIGEPVALAQLSNESIPRRLEVLLPDAVAGALGDGAIVLGDAGDRTLVAFPWDNPIDDDTPEFSPRPQVLGPPTPWLLAADLLGTGRNQLIVYDGKQATLLELDGEALREAKNYSSDAFPAIADFNGDSRLDIANVSVATDRTPIIQVLTPSLGDQSLWRKTLPAPTETGLPWHRSAYLRTGRFTGRASPDIYLFAGEPTVRSLVLRGDTGDIAWEKFTVPGLPRYWGPTMNHAAAADFDGDDRDEFVFTNPDYYCVADGRTGALRGGPASPRDIFKQASAGLYTLPAVLDRAGTNPLIALLAGHFFQGVITPEAKPRWYRHMPTGEARSAREGLLRLADGQWLIGFGRQNGTFACVDAASGSPRWDLPLQASTSDVLTCDVDSDGAQEFVFATSHGELIAVGDGGTAPRVLWRLPLEASGCAQITGFNSDYSMDPGLGYPIAADLDGDGAVEIVLCTVDGIIHVYGANRSAGTSVESGRMK